MKKAIITMVTKGKNWGQFRFTLKGANGETVAVSHPEIYTRKSKCKQTLLKCFPDFIIIDETIRTK